MKKRSSLKNLKKRVCIVTACEKNITYGFSSRWMNTLKSLLLINKVYEILCHTSTLFNLQIKTK